MYRLSRLIGPLFLWLAGLAILAHGVIPHHHDYLSECAESLHNNACVQQPSQGNPKASLKLIGYPGDRNGHLEISCHFQVLAGNDFHKSFPILYPLNDHPVYFHFLTGEVTGIQEVSILWQQTQFLSPSRGRAPPVHS